MLTTGHARDGSGRSRAAMRALTTLASLAALLAVRPCPGARAVEGARGPEYERASCGLSEVDKIECEGNVQILDTGSTSRVVSFRGFGPASQARHDFAAVFPLKTKPTFVSRTPAF